MHHPLRYGIVNQPYLYTMYTIIIQDQKFLKVGQLMAMSFIHGGNGFPFLSPSVFKYLCGVSLPNIDVDVTEIPDIEVRFIAEEVQRCVQMKCTECYTCMHVCIVVQMKKATTDEELRSLCLKDDNVQFIMDAGSLWMLDTQDP